MTTINDGGPMTDRYERIRAALAMGPTPGPWAACRTNSGTFVKSERLAGYFVEVRHCRTAQDVNADAHLIAACDPDTIRELLAERDALARAAIAKATGDDGDDDAAPECTCAAKDMTFGRCCKVTPNKCKWCGHDNDAHDRQYGCAEDGCDCETPNV